jgi:hypothetical protein
MCQLLLPLFKLFLCYVPWSNDEILPHLYPEVLPSPGLSFSKVSYIVDGIGKV